MRRGRTSSPPICPAGSAPVRRAFLLDRFDSPLCREWSALPQGRTQNASGAVWGWQGREGREGKARKGRPGREGQEGKARKGRPGREGQEGKAGKGRWSHYGPDGTSSDKRGDDEVRLRCAGRVTIPAFSSPST